MSPRPMKQPFSEKWYKKRVDRNYRVLSSKIEAIKNTSVMIVGVGGVGGVLSELLVRAGFRRLIISDGSNFEPSNINRQIGATFKTSTRELNKAFVMKQRLLEIDPTCDISIIRATPKEKYSSFQQLAEEFKVSIVANCIDILEDQIKVAKLARELKAYLIIGGVIKDGTDGIVAVFTPHGIKYENLLYKVYKEPNFDNLEKKLKREWFRKTKDILPKDIKTRYELNLTTEPFPVLTPLPWIIAGIMAMEIIKISTKSHEPVLVPKVIFYKGWCTTTTIVDLEDNPESIYEMFPWRP